MYQPENGAQLASRLIHLQFTIVDKGELEEWRLHRPCRPKSRSEYVEALNLRLQHSQPKKKQLKPRRKSRDGCNIN